MTKPDRGAAQARLTRLIRQPGTDLIPSDGPDATAVGLVLAKTGATDIADAHIAVCAQRAQQVIVTGGAAGLRRISPGLRLLEV